MNQYLRRKIWTLNRSGKFRGYLRTVSGYPVTLTDCMAGQPVSMAVDGNAVQDGTPTPDNPVDVQLCGDRTANLFDVQNINWNDITSGANASDSIHFENGVIRFVKNTTFYNQCRMLASIRLKPNTTYTMMYDHAVINYKDGTSIAQNSPYFRIYKSSDIDSTFNDTGFNNYYAATLSTILTFTTDETTDFEILFNSPIVPHTELLFTLKSYEVHGFMLIEGAYTAETMPAYEPYGYKVPLTMTGMNLLSNNENDWVGDAGIYKHFKIPVEGTTTLQLKLKEGKSIPEKLYLGYSKNGMDATGGVTWLIANGIFNGAPIRTSELKYISIHPNTALLDEIFDSLDIMLIEGAYTAETMPAYEPYGYKVPLTMTGMNLLSNNENDWVGDAGIYKHFKIPVEGTTTLQLKLKEGKSIPEKLYLGYSKNGMDATGGVTWLIANGIFNGAPIRTSELKYISIHPNTALLDEIFDSLDIMLIEGAYTSETMPAYEPYREPRTFNIYTPQQLAKVGDTADTVVLDFDNKTAKLVNAVGIDVLSAYSTRETLDDVCGFFCLPVKYDILQNSNVGVTNRFVCKYGYRENIEKAFIAMYDPIPKYVLYIAKTRIGYTEEDTSDTLVQKANDWLNENETYGLYSIANPITTDITALQDWDAMPPLCRRYGAARQKLPQIQ
mgnify:CR=1 FL=1